MPHIYRLPSSSNQTTAPSASLSPSQPFGDYLVDLENSILDAEFLSKAPKHSALACYLALAQSLWSSPCDIYTLSTPQYLLAGLN